MARTSFRRREALVAGAAALVLSLAGCGGNLGSGGVARPPRTASRAARSTSAWGRTPAVART